ncbi:MAG: adenine deaminase [Sphaerochaetaceae bacterium]|nr:adenine deaminase [Sphaerochaetaceae bacterium]
MDKNQLKHLIEVASGRAPADLCITNCNILDVFNKEVFQGEVYIADGMFAGFGGPFFPEAYKTVDANGAYMAPGFIDSHLHIESSHLSPAEYSRLVIPCGTTTVVADPHEIVNVCGVDGLDYMLKASEGLPLSVFLQFPSCVPATPFENAGAKLTATDIASRIDNPRVLGLGELMDFVGVCNADDAVLEKIMVAKNAKKVIDGHYLGLLHGLDAYSCAGIANDHECATAEDLRARIRRGMYVLLRQGTVCHDLLNLLEGVDSKNAERCLMCTDDCQAKTMLEIGHIDNNIRMAIAAGVDPIVAISMATINAATCFGLSDRGAIAPGRRADFVLLSSLDKDMKVLDVYTAGSHVASSKKYLVQTQHVSPENVSGKMNIKDYEAKRFALKLKSENVRTMKILPGSVVTAMSQAKVQLDENGIWHRNGDDIVKISVVERHHGTGNIGIGLLEGFGLKGGAVATSVAHDSHNVIVAGDSDKDMEVAVGELVRLGGGMVVVKDGKVLESVQHEIAGLMTDLPGEVVAQKLASIQKTAREKLGIHDDIDPFMTLCFMSLPVIPEIKITDMGLFDLAKFGFVPVELDI